MNGRFSSFTRSYPFIDKKIPVSVKYQVCLIYFIQLLAPFTDKGFRLMDCCHITIGKGV